MHASISAHIAREYLLDEAAGRWGPNLALFAERLGNEGRKAHVENLYFAYLFVLRAVRKAGPLLERIAFETGMPEADARTQALVAELVRLGLAAPTWRTFYFKSCSSCILVTQHFYCCAIHAMLICNAGSVTAIMSLRAPHLLARPSSTKSVSCGS